MRKVEEGKGEEDKEEETIQYLKQRHMMFT
jgi:hypothetical protein